MPRYVIERTFPDGFKLPINDEGVRSAERTVANNMEERVTWVHSYVTDDRLQTFCVYDGPTPEAVRRAAQRNGLPVERITEVRVLDPYFYY